MPTQHPLTAKSLHTAPPTFTLPVLRVTTREELAKALRERSPQVVVIIANNKLVRPFEWLLWAQELRWWWFGALGAAVVCYAISQQNDVKFKATDWQIGRTTEFEISLTPTSPRAPSSLPEE